MLIRLLILFGIISCAGEIDAQDYIRISDAEEKVQKIYKKAGSLSRKGESDKAIALCSKQIKRNPQILDFYARRGSIYFNKENYQEAEKDFQFIVNTAVDFEPVINYSLALSQYKQQKYSLAAKSFNAYLSSDPEAGRRSKNAKKLYEDCKFAAQAIKNPVPFEPIRLDSAVNTEASEYYPVMSLDKSKMIFTRKVNGQEDFYQVDLRDSISKSSYMTDLNTPYSEGVHCLSPDGRTIIYTKCDTRESYGSCDLFFSVFRKGRWSPSYNLGPEINTAAWEAQPSLSGDGQRLYFSSKRAKGHGGSDIYMSQRDINGRWTTAVNLGPIINSKGHDESPFIHPDDETLFFRTNGRPGMGDYDIYFSKRNNEDWTEPVNIGYPINTRFNDGALTTNLEGDTAFIASDRHYEALGQRPNLDIFKFELYKGARPRACTYVKGKVRDIKTKKGLRAKLELKDSENGEVIKSFFTGKSGGFFIAIPVDIDYQFYVEKEGYSFYSDYFELGESRKITDPYILDVYLQTLGTDDNTNDGDKEVLTPIILNNIFFESGKAQLLTSSQGEITKLYDLLTEYPNMEILIVGHTDNVGQPEHNQKLSERRANAVVTELTKRGVSSDRLTFKGAGEAEPIADNGTPDGRQKNRRTEFVILKN